MKLSVASSFEMAHQLTKADCAACNETVHGHTYKWGFSVIGNLNPYTGMVVDLSILKKQARKIDNIFDHALWVGEGRLNSSYEPTNKKMIFTPGFDPTAEHMALVVLSLLLEVFPVNKSPQLFSVWIEETEGTTVSLGVDEGIALCEKYKRDSLCIFAYFQQLMTIRNNKGIV